MSSPGDTTARPAGPLWLLAELTYRCPLHCVFCYNPVDYKTNTNELINKFFIISYHSLEYSITRFIELNHLTKDAMIRIIHK